MEKEFNYVYVITNLINNKQYVGDHSTNNLNDGYFGSGTMLIKKVKQYGKENFKKDILEFFPTKLEAFNAQEKYINLYESNIRQGGYNISPKGGYGCNNSYLSEETKAKMRKPKSDTHKKNMSVARKGIKLSKETKEKISNHKKGSIGFWRGKTSPMKGKSFSEESKIKLSESKKGTIPWNKGMKGQYKTKPVTKETKEKISISQKGKIVSFETKKKMSESAKKRKR